MNRQLDECIPSDDNRGTAFDQLWRALVWRICRRFYWLDQVRIEDALGDAVLRRLTQDGGEVEGACEGTAALSVRSLYGEVCRQVGNSVRADRRRYRREQEYGRQGKKWPQEDFSVQNGLSAENISIDEQWNELERLLAGCNVKELAFVALRQQGIEDLTAFTEVLGIVQCPLEEQRQTVNRFWNSLRMRLRRLKEKWAKGKTTEF